MADLPYILAVEVSTVLLLWTGLSVWQRDRRAPGSRWFAALTAVSGIWGIGTILGSHGWITPWTQAAVTYLGVVSVAPLLTAVAAHAAALPLVRRLPWFPLALCLPGLFCYSLLFMGPWSNLYLIFDESQGREGPLFGVYTLYSYGLVILSIFLFGLAAQRWPREGLPKRIAVLTVALLIPLAGNAAYLYSGMTIDWDPTPVLMGFAAMPLRAAVFRSGILDVLPHEDLDLVNRLPVGLVLADDVGGVIQINAAAEELLGVPRIRALGRSLEALVADLPEGLEVFRSELQASRGHEVRCVLLIPRDAASRRAA